MEMLEPFLIRCVLNRPDSLHEAGHITAEMFTSPIYAAIWTEIAGSHSTGDMCDVVSLMDAFIAQGKQQIADRVSKLMIQDFGIAGNARTTAERIRSRWQVSQAVAIAADLSERAKAADGAAIDDAITRLMEIKQERASSEYTIKQAVSMAVEQIKWGYDNPGKIPGISTGLPSLDRETGGWMDSDLTIIGARPAMGKTAFMLNCALSAALSVPVGIISGEQAAKQIGLRALSIQSRVGASKMRAGRVDDGDWPKITGAVSAFASLPVYVDDYSSPSLSYVARQARKWKHQHGIGLLLVDYLQRMSLPKAGNRAEAVGMNAQGLKNLARDLNIPVIALAQVSRKCEESKDKRPSMGHLSDSSEIEKEADSILFLYRREVYFPGEDEGQIEILCEKSRHGPAPFRVKALWRGETMVVEEPDFATEYEGF